MEEFFVFFHDLVVVVLPLIESNPALGLRHVVVEARAA
jgi:hypothetical protein